jgi:hypothetical protein
VIEDVDGEVVDQKNLKVVQEVVIVTDVDQYLDPGLDHILGLEVVVAHGHMIDIAGVDVAGST